MSLDRRQFLRSAPSSLVASSSLAASLWSSFLWSSQSDAAKIEFPAALLVPKTGIHAALGRSMERAGMLAQGANGARQLLVFDTQGTPAGAVAAAKAARRAKASILLGPVIAGEVVGVVAVAGGAIPVLAFSNDAALRESGAFVLGITAAQSVTAVMHYAAGRGVRRIAVAGTGSAWATQVAAAAREAGRALNVEVALLPDGDVSAAPAMAGASDLLPDAVLVPGADALVQMAPALRAKGIQPLGAFSGIDLAPETLRALDGTWLAAPDPAGFAGFARAFEDRNGSPPGLITALAYDAVNIVSHLRSAGGVDRSGLLAGGYFQGACGAVRFREDGSAARTLAILAVTDGGLHVVAPPVTTPPVT